ncbi:MAG: hypothetical protein NTW86_10340 [Candidatus Sumerlaeota bacterium]|nr:hypothetical protein [Candidatus Sumerlaeota bacterium]
MNRLAWCVLAAIALVQRSWPAAIDVPTWQVNDAWDFSNTYTLLSNDPQAQASINLVETYTSTVQEILTESTPSSGTLETYRLVRSNGKVTGSGQVTASGIPFNVRMAPTGSTDTGELRRWSSDLSLVQEEFHIKGDVQAQVLIWVTVATIQVDWLTTTSLPAEDSDFPLGPTGETWDFQATLYTKVAYKVQFYDSILWAIIGGKPADVVATVYDTRPLACLYTLTGPDPLPTAADAVKYGNATVETDWYSPSAKQMAKRYIEGFYVDDAHTLGFSDAVLQVTASHVQADAAITSLAFTPPRPPRGQAFQLSGRGNPNAPVTAKILGEGGVGNEASTTSNASGDFTVDLLAPGHDDTTPASADAGSFGVEVAVTGQGRKMVTLQTQLFSAVEDWRQY